MPARVLFLVGHYCLFRGDNTRVIELADMSLEHLPNEGISPCDAVIIQVNHGKTNQYGKSVFVGMIRNRNVHTCPIGAIVFWFFHRFHINMEPFPDMTTSEKWFLIKFVPGRKGRESCMCYSTHANMYKRIFKKFGIST